MNNYLKLICLGLGCSIAALAAEGMKVHVNGSAEAGFAHSWQPASGAAVKTKESQLALDDVTLKMTFEASEKTKVVVQNAFAVAGRTPATYGTALSNGLNSNTYYSNATLTGAAGARLAFANNGAYIEHKCTDWITASAGHFRVPFGMESMGHRYDTHSYYYSTAYRVANTYQWYYDTGLLFTLKDMIPGTLELAVIDGRDNLAAADPDSTPGAVARYSYEWSSGDMSITPTASLYTARWVGGPKDLGISAGLNWKMGSLWANAEFVRLKSHVAAAADPNVTDTSIVIEPGIDLGMANVSLKVDKLFNKTAADVKTDDWNLGAALSKNYDGYRIRLVYQHLNFQSAAGRRPGNDIRLLFGTKW